MRKRIWPSLVGWFHGWAACATRDARRRGRRTSAVRHGSVRKWHAVGHRSGRTRHAAARNELRCAMGHGPGRAPTDADATRYGPRALLGPVGAPKSVLLGLRGPGPRPPRRGVRPAVRAVSGEVASRPRTALPPGRVVFRLVQLLCVRPESELWEPLDGSPHDAHQRPAGRTLVHPAGLIGRQGGDGRTSVACTYNSRRQHRNLIWCIVAAVSVRQQSVLLREFRGGGGIRFHYVVRIACTATGCEDVFRKWRRAVLKPVSPAVLADRFCTSKM